MKNNNKNNSNHPEMNEDPIEVSKDVPNTVEEFIDMQDIFKLKSDIKGLDEIDDGDLCREIIENSEDKMSKISKEIFEILHGNHAGPNEDLKLSIILLKRIKGFQEFLRKKMVVENDSQKKLLINISEDIMRLKMILKLLEEVL